MSDSPQDQDPAPAPSAGADSSVPTASRRGEPLDRQTVIVGLVVILGLMMVILDTTMVNVALNTLGSELHATLSTAQWVVTGYLLALGLVMPVSGWAADRFGPKRIWMISLALFVAGSVLSGLAWSMSSLIVFRLLQGAAGGMLMPVGQAIIARIAGPERMGRAMSLLGVPMLLGPVAGPIIGGVLVQQVSWHWIFYVNLPIGLIALVAAFRVLPSSITRPGERLDILGLILASSGFATLVYGLSSANTAGGFTNPHVYGWIAGGLVLLAAFVVHSLRQGASALIDVRLFANRDFSAAAATIVFLGFGMFGSMLLLPLYYQIVLGNGALNAGLLLAPQGLGAVVAMPIAGWFTDRIGARRVVLPGIALALTGTYFFTQVRADTSEVLLAGALFVRGLGLGSTTMPSMASAYLTLRQEAVGRASATLNIVRQIGASFGTSVLAVVLVGQVASRLPAGSAGAGLGAIGSIPPGMREQVAPLLAGAFGQTFWVAFALTALVFVPAIFLPDRRTD
jgi:EmrB/QacA subfamily drug resistance transporter